jgi:hypothetical protein
VRQRPVRRGAKAGDLLPPRQQLTGRSDARMIARELSEAAKTAVRDRALL